ncbi:MAG: hypothetical protein K9I36_17040 [Bacteroidia bacterium]|nr:hypothetical protein [Bacteroidia bacterium]
MKYLQIELPSLHLEWQRNNGERIISSVIRTNYAKPSLVTIPAIIQNMIDWEIEAIDMKIRQQDCLGPYKEFKYGDGMMVASRMGIPFENLEIQLSKVDVIGVSVNPTSWSGIAIDFFRYAKTVNPKILIIAGGTDVIFRQDYYLKNGLVDFVISGEAETNLVNLLKAIKYGNDFSKVDGISFINSGNIHKTKKCIRTNLDELPLEALGLLKQDIPLWNEPIEYFPLPKEVKTPIGMIFLTRGCSEACDFCTTPKKMGRFRFMSIEKIHVKIIHFKNHGINTINIWDDSISSVLKLHPEGYRAGRKYLKDVIQILWDNKIAFEFSQGIVIKHLWNHEKDEPDYDLINVLYSNQIDDGQFIGCYAEYFPTECLQEDERYKKLMSFEKEKEVLLAILKAGTKIISFSSIMGSKEDNPASFNLATQRLKELKKIVETSGGKALATPFIFSIFPGAKVWNDYKENIQFDIQNFPELYQLNAAAHGNASFNAHEITLAKKEMEQQLFTPEQFKKWNSTGRYQW